MAWDTPLEADIEKHFVAQCKKQGWLPEKFTAPGKRSVPDRIVSKTEGDLFLCELKAPGKKPTPKQAEDHRKRRERGFRVYVADTYEAVRQVVEAEKLIETEDWTQ